MKLKKILLFVMCLFLLVLQIFVWNISIISVKALDDFEVKAVEHYDRNITIGLGDFGKVGVVVTISHNMTTGKSCVYNVKATPRFNHLYPFLKFNSVSTSPAKGVYFTGPISIKVTVKYTNDIPGTSKSYAKYGYIDI